MKSNKFFNFLYYNRLKIVLAAAIIALFAVTFVQCGETKKNETDFSVFYVSETEIMDEEKFCNELYDCGIIEDSNGRDGVNIKIKTIYIPESVEVMNERGIPEQLKVEFTSGECSLYILDKETIYENEILEVFADLTELADKYKIPQDKRYIATNGTVCAISLEGNRYLNENGAPCDAQYLAIRYHEKGTGDGRINNALNMAEYILSKGE